MKPLKRIRYHTMNSWNNSTAPAYNLKVRNVVNNNLQDKVYELLEVDELWQEINELIREFDKDNDYAWQAGFNGRSGGYLVLYVGGYNTIDCYTDKEYEKEERVYSDLCGCWLNKEEAKERGALNFKWKRTYSKPGLGIEDDEVPTQVLKDFRKLAIDIVKTAEGMAKNFNVVDEDYTVTKTRKVLA